MKMTFQGVTRDSFFTRLDFRSKLCLMVVVTVVACVWESPFLNGLMALATVATCLAAGIQWGYLRFVCTLLLPFYLLLIVTQGFFGGPLIAARTGQTTLTPLFTFPASWALVGGGEMSIEGVWYALNIVFKTLTLTLVVPLGVFTTDVNAMTVGMVRARIPYKLAFIFSSTLRFFPLFFGELQAISEAQRLRGLAWEKLGPFRRVSVYAKVAVPLILGALVKSQQLEVVLQSKAFSGSPDRTYLHESQLEAADYWLFAGCILFLVVAGVAYLGWGIGRFGGPV
ncbi:MAG: energy-coupling factor transporter transmembrane protein EcfT [Anaerolineae bacterium]|nr:energy-coupling factor transporter transmembrane protein EcfT [Anaerolineae bacterium]